MNANALANRYWVKDAKVEVVKNVGGILTLRLKGTSNGNKNSKDFHEEFFTGKTDFGDDISKDRYATYDHLPPPWAANPFASRILRTEPIGKATLDETNEQGRWFIMELSKSEEYHEYFMELAKMGVLGASTQCLPGSKTVLPSGEITAWFETEIALTVQPADPKTLGTVNEVNELAKSLNIPLWTDIKSSLEDRVIADNLAEAEEAEAAKAKDAPIEVNSDPVEPAEEGVREINVTVDVETLEKDIQRIVAETLVEPMKALNELLTSVAEAVVKVDETFNNDEFKAFMTGFSESLEKHGKTMKASSFLLAKVSTDVVIPEGTTPSNGSNADVGDEGEEEEIVKSSASLLPAGAPGKK